MTLKKIVIVLILSCVALTLGCGNYSSYTKTVKVTLVSDSSTQTEITEIATERKTITSTTIVISEANNTMSDAIEQKIYCTKSGKSYHYANPCGRGTYYECTLEEALEKGLKPCKKCVE